MSSDKIFVIEAEPLLLPCHCCGNRHPLIVQYYVEAEGNFIFEQYVYFYYHLIHNSLFKRIVSAIRLVLGLKPKEGDFAYIDLDASNATKLRDYLNQFLKDVDKATVLTKKA